VTGLINAEHRSLAADSDNLSFPGDEAGIADAPAQANAPAPLSILLVEDEGIVARDVEETLTRLGYHVSGIASEGAQAVAMAEKLQPQLVVMDVSLRGELDGIQAARLIQQRSHVPIIFLTGHTDTETLHRAVLTGPLGYLIKPFQEAELHSTIEVAIHKHRAERATREREEALRRSAERMQSLSLLDELTQLKNRRGFFELAQQALKVARREQQALALFFMDLNGLKQINDTLGHLTGDQSLRDAAGVLRATFRDSDIVARIGGDEFVALAHVQASRDIEALRARLRDHLQQFNIDHARPYVLDISIGTTSVEAHANEGLEAVIARADAAMYEQKQKRSRR
jgi:two-component system, cell cycle response regulator